MTGNVDTVQLLEQIVAGVEDKAGAAADVKEPPAAGAALKILENAPHADAIVGAQKRLLMIDRREQGVVVDIGLLDLRQRGGAHVGCWMLSKRVEQGSKFPEGAIRREMSDEVLARPLRHFCRGRAVVSQGHQRIVAR